jgi:hypothetical protein
MQAVSQLEFSARSLRSLRLCDFAVSVFECFTAEPQRFAETRQRKKSGHFTGNPTAQGN